MGEHIPLPFMVSNESPTYTNHGSVNTYWRWLSPKKQLI